MKAIQIIAIIAATAYAGITEERMRLDFTIQEAREVNYVSIITIEVDVPEDQQGAACFINSEEYGSKGAEVSFKAVAPTRDTQCPITLWKVFQDTSIEASTLKLATTSKYVSKIADKEIRYRVWIITKEAYQKEREQKAIQQKHYQTTGKLLEMQSIFETNNVSEFYACQKKITRLREKIE